VRTAGPQACRRAGRYKRQSGRRPESLFPSICNPRQCSTRLVRKPVPVNIQSSSVFHPLVKKSSCQSAIPLGVPPVCSDSLFPSICNPRQCSTRLVRKPVPVNIQSSSVFHSFGQKACSRQYTILVSVPPVWSESLFPSIYNPRQCSTRLVR